MKRKVLVALLLCGVAAGGCAHRPVVEDTPSKPAPLPSAEAAAATLAALSAHEPSTFKMIHQVAAKYETQSFVMTGYVLGRKDGAFRVSAVAAMGPKLFDIVYVDGRWQSVVHLKQLAEKLDPVHIGRSVQRIYFTGVKGTWEPREGAWVMRAPLTGDEEVDSLEVWRDGATMALLRKRFFKGDQWQTDIVYEQPEWQDGHWLARRIRLSDRRGFELQIQVTDYTPGAPVPPERLQLGMAKP